MESWTREYHDAVALSDDIASRISASQNSPSPLMPSEASRLSALVRRKITMLGTKLDSLQSLLGNPSLTKFLYEKELDKRKAMVQELRVKMNKMTASLDLSRNVDSRNSLFEHDGHENVKENNRTSGMSNSGIIALQQQIIRGQDEDLAKLEETVVSTRHIALAVNEELDLHTKLLDELDQDVDITNNRLKVVQRRLGFVMRKVNNTCSCMSSLLMIFVIVLLVLAIFTIVRYL